jgi:phage/plasmid primase-like uncharacterized protein
MIIDIAKAVPIETEIARRGIRLVGRGADRCGPCQVCGGRDRFSINTRKQVFNCRGCSVGGDVIDLVRHLDGVDFKTAIQTITGTERKPIIPVKPVQAVVLCDEADNTALALKIWADASPIQGTPAEKYLRLHRGLEPPAGDDVLRFHRSCPWGNSKQACMIALYRDIVTNEPKAISRTAINADGIKIKRLSLGPVGGCAIKLDPDENVEYGLHIGEGIETVLAGRQLGFRPAWALGSAGAIKAFPVLAGIESLTILADNDTADRNGRQAGQEAALACARRWHGAGREVHRITPNRAGTDMADIITKEKQQ